VTLGKPGTSFRYVQTFGVTEQAYPADTQHLNAPAGLFVDGGNNLYVVEELGHRMLKFDSSGNSVPPLLGTAGSHYIDNYVFDAPRGVAVDGSGNIWVVDNHRLTEFDSSGNYLRVFPTWDNQPWNCGIDNGHFCTPSGIAFDASGKMYVSDADNHRI
jgi:DNA-binding beta-propeller fold protein YncE